MLNCRVKTINKYLLFLFISCLLISCGLPEYKELPAPSRQDQPDPTSIGFQTPSNVSSITGYVLYYKIYYNQTDFDTENDSSAFQESTYSASGKSMPVGSTIPLQRGFARAGILNDSDLRSFQIPDENIANRYVYIDFDRGQLNRASMDDTSEQPAVIFDTYPSGALLSQRLCRGVNDPTNTASDKLLSFVADWDWNDTSPDDGYNDADLYRKKNLTASYSVHDIVESFKTGTAPPASWATGTSELIIGFAVYAQGFSPSPLTIIYSKPV
ncbi:MAG: hypothetical protein CSA76_03445, partial [Spirochaetales bacterium]